jgi:hypothetical protein
MPAPGSSGDRCGVPELPSPYGAWRLTVRRLGKPPADSDGFGVLARVEAGGTVTVFAGGQGGEPGIGGWKSAGPGRVVVLVEWFVRDTPGGTLGRLSVRAAAEMSADGRTCQARLQWRHLDLAGSPQGEAVTGEADGTRLEP